MIDPRRHKRQKLEYKMIEGEVTDTRKGTKRRKEKGGERVDELQ